jgi:uncharacterized membrane protein
MFTTITVLACIGAGTIGGVFFAFSTFVMKALLQLPPGQGVAAMQRINVVVLNPLFLSAFVGTVAIEVGCVLLSLSAWNASRSMLVFAAALLYAVGTFLVTMKFNVPMNNRLARLDPGSSEAASYWPTYVREWSKWNHVRTAASLVSLACSAAALALRPL